MWSPVASGEADLEGRGVLARVLDGKDGVPYTIGSRVTCLDVPATVHLMTVVHLISARVFRC